MGRRIDLYTMEMLPGQGVPVAGGGIRAWSLAEGLRAAGHAVRVCLPAHLLGAHGSADCAGFPAEALQGFVNESPAELFVFEQWYPLSLLERLDRPVVVDLPGPLLLENHWRQVAASERMALAKLRALARADLWLHATPRQRYYWLAFMALAGLDLARPPLLHAPIALPLSHRFLNRPAGGDRDPARFVHAGIFWPWQDPTGPLATLLDCLRRAGHGSLVVYGGAHPQHAVEGQRYLDPTPQLAACPQLDCRGLLPFEQLAPELETAGVALDVVPVNAERELSSTIRSVVYLHCGLALVLSRHSYLAEAVEQAGAGWVVESEAPSELAPLFETILTHPEEVQRRGEAAHRLAVERFACPQAWGEVLARLDTLTPGERPEPFTERLDRRVRELERELRTRIAELEGIAAAQAGEIAFLSGELAERDAGLHHARLARQALEEAYAIASRDLEALRASLPYRTLQALRRLLGKARTPDDHRPRIPPDWQKPLD